MQPYGRLSSWRLIRPKHFIRLGRKNPLSPKSQVIQAQSRWGHKEQRQIIPPPLVALAPENIMLPVLPPPPSIPVFVSPIIPPVIVSAPPSEVPTPKNVSSVTTSGESENNEISKVVVLPIPLTLGPPPQSTETMETDSPDLETCYDSDYERLDRIVGKDPPVICMVWNAGQTG